ncbi:MAG: hypothetical protein NVS1B10_06070 [Candidatus Saccharimonadales bacterium]
MNFDINFTAGLVAGLAAMVPGSIIYSPIGFGKLWLKALGMTEKQMKASGGQAKAMVMMLITSLVNGVVASLIVTSMGADSVLQSVEICLVLSWFWISAGLMLVFFEKRNATLFWINSLSHVLTLGVIGLVIGLFIN